MLALDAIQSAIVASDSKDVKWSFTVFDKNGVGYQFASGPLGSVAWATGISWDSGITWDTGVSLSSILITDFGGIELRRNSAESGIISPSEVTFTISNANNTLAFLDFKGGSVKIELFLSNATYGEQKIAGWKFRIKTAQPGYQNLKITAEDFLQYYLKGSYPNTRIPQDIFPSSRSYDNDALCVPVPFGTAYVPLRDVFITDAGYLMLGDPTFTYTIEKIRNPRSTGTKCEWDHADFTFTQSTKADADAVDWRVFQAIIADADSDGTADAAGFWGGNGGPILDPPVKFTRSDTATITNPADVIEFVLKDMGIPADNIDAVSFAAAKATFTTLGITFNGAFWYKQTREKALTQLLTMCHSCLHVGEKIELNVFSKTSKKTITGAEVTRSSEQGEGSFSYQDIVNEDYSDCGYIAYQEAGEAQDSFNKVLVPSKGTTATVISSDTLECPFVQDSQDVRRIGTLHYQRKLLKETEVGFLAKGTCLALQPDDVITIDDANYGGTYTVLVDSVKIANDISMQFQCSKYISVFDDWEDISPAVLTIPADTTTGSWTPPQTGPDSTNSVTPNTLPGRLRIGSGSDYILLDPDSPLRISLYDNDVEIFRAGNLNGFLDYVAETYGLAIGETTKYLKYDSVNGLRIAGAITGSTIDIGGDDATSFHVDADGNVWSGASVANKATAPLRLGNTGTVFAGDATQYMEFDGTYFKLGPDTKLLGSDAYNNDNVYYHTRFESLDGYTQQITGDADIYLTGVYLRLHTGDRIGEAAVWSYARYLLTNEISFTNNSRFKTRISLSSLSFHYHVAQMAYIVIGRIPGDKFTYTDHGCYGFWIYDGEIYGITEDSSGNTTTLDLSVVIPNSYVDGALDYSISTLLEAVWVVGVGVSFYLDGVYKGQITTNLPSDNSSQPFPLFSFYLTSTENFTYHKWLTVREFFFLQD